MPTVYIPGSGPRLIGSPSEIIGDAYEAVKDLTGYPVDTYKLVLELEGFSEEEIAIFLSSKEFDSLYRQR